MKEKKYSATSPATKSDNFTANSKKKRGRFALIAKLVLVFGLMIIISNVIQGIISVRTARKAVIETVNTHLIDKAADTASIIDGRIDAFFQYLEGIARMPKIRDRSISYREKTILLDEEVEFNPILEELYIVDTKGTQHHADGTSDSYASKEWFKKSISGQRGYSEPYIDTTADNKLLVTFSLPVYDDNKNIIGVLGVDLDGLWLSEQISDIVIGETGYCYILGFTGIALAHKDPNAVIDKLNLIEESKTDKTLVPIGTFAQHALDSNESEIWTYTFKGVNNIASYAKMESTGWTVIVTAPYSQFMGAVDALRTTMIIIGLIVLLISLVIVYFVSKAMVKPMKIVVSALKDIAQGDGDLTVRLPVSGNDEVTELSLYFNQTVEKIRLAIKTIDVNAYAMLTIGEDLEANIHETASAIKQITGNVESVKEETVNQSASVTETAATMEEIIKTIKLLNANIESQAASVTQSSASIEEMVANIASITQTLETSNESIKSLASATEVGKNTLLSSNTITQKIAEESGSLMEASSVIQHIASQTNLLAMNAAIEAAHAGDAGKGFAVVADEIRKLAEDSATQGKTITATLKTLGTEIETLSNSSKTVEEKFNVIFMLSEQVKAVSESLMRAMREQDSGSKEVLSAIKNINDITSKVKNGSEEMLQGGEQIAEEMHRLDELTRNITESMNEMSAGAIQISNAVEEVSTISYRNKTNIENLTAEVNKFKLTDDTKQSDEQDQALDIGIDLNKAVRSHIQWKVKLRSAISNQEQLDVKNISSDCACEFGKWLHGKAKDTYKNSQTYIKCLEKHALFHTEAGKIALKINERKFAEAEAMLIAGSPFNLASNEVTNAVKVLKSSIVNV